MTHLNYAYRGAVHRERYVAVWGIKLIWQVHMTTVPTYTISDTARILQVLQLKENSTFKASFAAFPVMMRKRDNACCFCHFSLLAWGGLSSNPMVSKMSSSSPKSTSSLLFFFSVSLLFGGGADLALVFWIPSSVSVKKGKANRHQEGHLRVLWITDSSHLVQLL